MPIGIRLDGCIPCFGRLLLFELNQEKIIRAVEETEWGAPVKVILNEV